MADTRAHDMLVLYNLLRQEIEAIEMALEAVRMYTKSEGRHDSNVKEALAKVEASLGEIQDNAERLWRVHTHSGGTQ